MHAHELEAAPAPAPRLSVNRARSEDVGSALSASAAGALTPLSPASVLHLQRTAGNQNVNSLLDQDQEASPVHEVVGSGGGSPLDSPTRGFMEDRLGADFSDVRIHTGAKADQSARSINAQAYTVGSDVVFQSGKYAPDTDPGRHMLAHELTHVVQQRSGPVAGTPAAGGIMLSHPSDAFEQAAERSADRVTAEGAASPAAATAQATSVQRQEEEEQPEEETAQRMVVQRASEEEEQPEEGGE
ncbi:MAG: DUF4157 domain-containing protein [Candidatus Dormibacteraeota bacterium]|nr:DUF4157 domain-containing protein [Candidatus Dormibacteraeota bacterium]